VVRETKEIVDNGFSEVYVNAKVDDGSDVSELMRVFVEDTAYNDKFPNTSERKRKFKESEGGLSDMCEIMEKLAREERAEGERRGKAEIILNMYQNNFTLEQIALATSKTPEEIEEIIKDSELVLV
jgi:predicted transposase/invertase (TIGR01784 family)